MSESTHARESLSQLDDLTETALHELRQPWLNPGVRVSAETVTATAAFVRDASQRVRRAQELAGPDERLDDLALELSRLCEQFDRPTPNVAAVANGFVGLSVRIPEVRARLLQDARFGDPIGELREKFEVQETVWANLTCDVESVRLRLLHQTAVVRQAKLIVTLAERGRRELVDGRLTYLPSDPGQISIKKRHRAEAEAADAALGEIKAGLDAATDRSAVRLQHLRDALSAR